MLESLLSVRAAARNGVKKDLSLCLGRRRVWVPEDETAALSPVIWSQVRPTCTVWHSAKALEENIIIQLGLSLKPSER